MDSGKGERLGERIFVVGTLVAVVVLILALVLPALSFARTRAIQEQCRQHLKHVELQALVWAHDKGNPMPRTFLEFSDYLSSPTNLICPAAPRARKEMQHLTSWKDFDERRSSYEILNPGVSTSNEHKLYLHCKAHDQFVAVDNSVHRLWDLTNGTFGFRYELPPVASRTNQTR